MKVERLEISGLLLLQLNVHEDQRGFFVERFNHKSFLENGLPTKFVQDNHSRSKPKTIRGLHYQINPEQGKLVGVTRGRIWDVAVDLRQDSPSFRQHYSIELSDVNGRLLWIPAGFAHGFCVLGEEPADVLYKVDTLYSPSGNRGLFWKDPELKIPWPIDDPILSEQDQKQPLLRDLKEGYPKGGKTPKEDH